MHFAQKVWERTLGLVRLGRWIPRFLADPLTVEQALAAIRQGIAEREERFFRLLRRGVYSNPDSPYRKLLAIAGCEPGDLESLVRRQGLDAALQALAENGVYVTFDEFKGRAPAVRGGQTLEFRPGDFDDPAMIADSVESTSGTTGKPMPIRHSFAHVEQSAAHWCVFFAANDCLNIPLLYWRPGHSGAIGSHLAWAKFGQRLNAWFISQPMMNPVDLFYAHCLNRLGILMAGFPEPREVPYHQPEIVLEHTLPLLSRHGRVCLNTPPSAAVRLSLAAQERGASLEGLTCLLGAEALSQARRKAIEASGARATPLYGSSEATWIGGQCPTPEGFDEVHVLRDLYAVIAGALPEGSLEEEPCPLLFTSLAPVTPLILINVNIGDRGILGSRRCGCLYDQLGCTQMLRSIQSADKITGYGVTFWVSDVVQVIEGTVVERLGGHPGDVQLIESQRGSGLPEYTLAVRPGLTARSDGEISQLFLKALARRKSYYGFMTAIWERDGILRIERRAPLAGNRGKILAFHRLRAGS